jgi:hypothetical protein
MDFEKRALQRRDAGAQAAGPSDGLVMRSGSVVVARV